jgi:glutathione S-transferase
MDAQEDLSHHIAATFGLKGDALRQAREKLVAGWLSIFVRGLGQLLARGGGRYFAGDALSMADLKTYYNTRWLRSGVLDHVPTDLVQRLAPGLVEHQERVAADPRVVAWYASRR